MALFHYNFDKAGPGVPENAPRKKGLARFWEMLSRDSFAFWRAGMLALLSALPFMLGVWFAVATHALLPLLAAGLLGGALMAPQLVGLNDTILRSLRDEPGYWWATYCRAWKRNAKASLLPGAVFGLVLGAQIFALFHIQWGQNLVLTIAMLVGVFFLSGLALLTFTQIALLEMSFGGILRNALLLLLGYLPRAALAVLWLLLYTAAVALFFPLSVPVLLLLNFWLPVQAALQAFYPVLDKTFDLEKTIKAMRDADLNQPDGDDR